MYQQHLAAQANGGNGQYMDEEEDGMEDDGEDIDEEDNNEE